MAAPSNVRLFVLAGLLVALGLGILVSPWASGSPDGLERVALDQGFAEDARDHALEDGPLAGYGVEGVEDERVGRALAGPVGVLVTFGVGLALFGLLRVVRDRRARTANEAT